MIHKQEMPLGYGDQEALRILAQKELTATRKYKPLFTNCQGKSASTNDFRHRSAIFGRASSGVENG